MKRIGKRYINDCMMLYGDQPAPERKEATPRKPALCLSEDHEQMIAATWLRKSNVLFYHVPNGGYRNAKEGLKFKRMGVIAGVPDICIPIPRSPYHGLYIELKRKVNAHVTDSQKWWLDELAKQGYDVFVAYGADDLIKHVKFYLGEEK